MSITFISSVAILIQLDLLNHHTLNLVPAFFGLKPGFMTKSMSTIPSELLGYF